ncbi:mismatch repair ATPase MLH1 [Sugiyamaella lignohabitans]|uniref:Mismatch repair ATPase MLH1 n=1 Tax=Sugiyamaella lignohabitans TaxID=796027 RepID=A0A167E383_9ASCO|nr:mismatch repair ATPase MLH1 [Sugiyamaella lignohabitans]ANB13584.1 mismatch repair ATPase MLH1 [Sugiyamaella lignohabitans]
MADRRIQKLEASVVNRIAAGEIIVGPSNALKELFENSVDAGSTSIDIAVKDGGLKLLQITDDGCGIVKDDLPILCERFTTSKIKTFDDLTSIESYGFRGEALASISHIAHVTVTTRTKDEQVAWKAQYLDGAIVPRGSKPKPQAGKVGTQITVEDLFFNVPSRKRAFRSPSEEYTKILDVVGRYIVHCQGVGISCKRQGDPHPTYTVRKEATHIDRIRTVFGPNVANELLEIKFNAKDRDNGVSSESVEEGKKIGLRKISGFITNANYSSKKSISPVVFVNNRLVTFDALRRALSQLYSGFLPRGGHYFSYLSLKIDPQNVDVNVHPTKREVHFLFEEEIIDFVCSQVQKALADVDVSRSFETQTIIPGVNSTPVITRVGSSGGSSGSAKRVYEYNLVRTDPKQPKISSLFSTKTQQSTPSKAPRTSIPLESEFELPSESLSELSPDSPALPPSSGESQKTNEDATFEQNSSNGFEKSPAVGGVKSPTPRRAFLPTTLRSIKQLREEVKLNAHKGLTDVFSNHTFVGIVDYNKRLAALQYDVKLLLVDYGAVCKELFYQIGLSEFANFGAIELDGETEEGISVRQLLQAAVNVKRNDGEKITDNFVDETIEMLADNAEMVKEYFNLTFTPPTASNSNDLFIKTIPLLLRNYMPPLNKLPGLMYQLGTAINWEIEIECFRDILTQLALFYTPEPISTANTEKQKKTNEQEDETDSGALAAARQNVRENVEIILFPSIQKRLIAPRSLAKDTVEIANLPGLYKIFERC